MSGRNDARERLLGLLGVDRHGFERWLSEVFDMPVTLIGVTELDASSRESPWRLDLDSNVARRAILRFGGACSANEATALRLMEGRSVPAPKLFVWDQEGSTFGVPVFLSDHIDGESLLDPLKAGDRWAEDLYIETACALQTIEWPPHQAAQLRVSQSAADVLEEAYAAYDTPDDLIHSAYRRLVATMPELPETRFSNGDLWPENLLVRDRRLVAVIDWQHAGFSDPIFEFLLPFFLVPELRDRGIEERYCEHMGFDPEMLSWYHGMEWFDSIRWVLKANKPYGPHTAESLRADLEQWLA